MLLGMAASIPFDLSGTARWHLSRSFVNSCPTISIRIFSFFDGTAVRLLSRRLWDGREAPIPAVVDRLGGRA